MRPDLLRSVGRGPLKWQGTVKISPERRSPVKGMDPYRDPASGAWYYDGNSHLFLVGLTIAGVPASERGVIREKNTLMTQVDGKGFFCNSEGYQIIVDEDQLGMAKWDLNLMENIALLPMPKPGERKQNIIFPLTPDPCRGCFSTSINPIRQLTGFHNRGKTCIFALDKSNTMTLQEAIKARHSVRKYTDKPIEPDKVRTLMTAVQRINAENGLNIQLVLEEPKSFSTGIWKYGSFSGVKNYFVMAGPKGKDTEEKIGWYGEELVLLAQTSGLNTCWVGLTYKKIPGTFTLRDGDIVHCVIALGYGTTPGVQHPQRPVDNFYECDGVPPEWFKTGMEAALLAPTAVNQQKFKFILHDGNVVEAKTLFALSSYLNVDLGIVKYHFEIGAGKGNFCWK